MDHVSKEGMYIAITQNWFTKGFQSYAQRFCERCQICITHNAGRVQKMQQAAHPQPKQPFDHIQMDFIELSPSEEKSDRS